MLGMTPTNREDAIKFETARIKVLQEERLYIQKKTFTKWVNSFLQKVRLEVEDLFVDLGDGKKLLKLLEIISGEKLGKPNHGRTRVHKIENVNKSLAFLHTKVRLESIGAEDIVDGNPRLILGLIWTIILRFQIQEIEIDVNEDDESSEKKSAKDALLLWCQRKTAGHSGVDVRDFTVSWRSGLAFNALIHSHRPDLLDYGALNPHNHIENLNNAFDVAQRELGIPRLLDAEDVDTNKPDEKSVITYVASYYHTFARMKNEMKGGRRIANIVAQMMEADKLKQSYEGFTSTLLEWIQKKITELTDRNFPNSLEGIQRELLKFKEYRTIEKPLKYKERSEVEGLLFGIQTKLKALGQPLYVPPEGKLVHDIERSWDQLEKAEHMREIALREELVRQEKLENLAYRFERKSVLREGYLKEMIQVLSDPRYGSNLSQVEATVKKHEAISADILAREERFHNLSAMVEELVTGNYHSKEKVKKREEEIIQKWKNLLELLNKHKLTLTNFSKLINMLREVDTIIAEIQAMESSFQSDDYGRHLLSVEDLLQKHSLVEMQISSQGETIRKLNSQSQAFIATDHKEAPRLEKKLGILNSEYEKLQKLAKARHSKLDESRAYFQFVQDHEEEEAWLAESQRICKTMVAGKDVSGALSLQQKHKSLEAEIQGRWLRAQRVIKSGEQLISERHPQSKDIRQRLDDLKLKWEELHKLAEMKCKQLEDLFEAYQYHADANEAESWMREKIPLVSSKDYGKDEPGAQALLQRHNRMDEEIHAYRDDIQRLGEQAERMIKSGIANLSLLEAYPDQADGTVNGIDESEQFIEEYAMVPVEEWVEEIVEKEMLQDVVEDIKLPQVKALYAFQGQGMDMHKGEVMILMKKTNSDWWNVRKDIGKDGFVPASYVKEVEPKLVKKVTKQTVKIPEKKRVLKTVLKRQLVRKRKEKPPIPKKPLKRSLSKQENNSVELRQKAINASYEQLIQLSKDRKHFLDDAIRLFGFYSECDDFESWMKDKEKMLTVNNPADSVEVMKKMFENFLTDLSASSRRVDDIDKMVEDFIDNNHSQLSAIKARQRQIHDRWNRLNKLKTEKERGLEGATSVELFNRTCDEARDWMLEKMDKIDIDEIGRDMKTVQALQRKHQNLERELAPVEEKFNRVNLLADSVKASYPTERNNVKQRQQELKELWDKVKVKAVERRTRLDESLGLQIFQNGSKALVAWVNQVKQALNNDEPARDVVTAENLLKNHTDLGDDIKAHEDEFCDLRELGLKLLPKSQDQAELQNMLLLLQEEQDAIHRGWQQKGDWLRQCIDLQIFNREADQIESITNSHDAYLDFHDMGTTLDDVEGLSKRHENFINTLLAQHDRLKTFSEMADKLNNARHYESKYIDERRVQILDRRQQVQEKAFQRRDQLLGSQSFQEFRAEADEISAWIQEKLKTAADESYRDLTNLERKLQKHEAFEAEVRANEARILSINNVGHQHVREGHYASDEITSILTALNGQWQELHAKAADKGQKLRQAVAQHTYNRTLDDARNRLDELQNTLASDDLGNDLRSVKDLLVKHQTLETELSTQEAKVDDLTKLGQDMAEEGHFDAPNILKATRALEDRLENLKGPAARRRAKLEESLKLHQFTFEVETEMQWIREHLPAASSTDLGQSLVDAQNMSKKHLKLEREIVGHQTMIDKTLVNGKTLTDQKHCASEQIKTKCQELKDAWQELIALSAERKKKLDLSLKAQQFFSETNEVEQWMTEKQDVLSSTDYGKDEDASVKLLTKHKAIELEIDTYSGLVTEMGCQAQKMVESNHPDSKVINNRMQVIHQQMKSLQKLASIRCQKLVEVKHQHEYFRESEELEQWINEQMQQATSEDFGQDFEHLLLLLNKFNDFKLRVESSSGRLSACKELGKKLLALDSPFSGEIESHQEQLGQSWELLLDCIESRDHKLQAAAEIHRFNRDVSEALSRIQEKYTSIPDDLGRDLHMVENMLRKHDGFENDLVALEGQLQVIIDDSVRMQALYPGGNAENIQQQQNIILENWQELQERTAIRRSELQASYSLQKLLSLIRTWETWAQDVCSSLQGEEKVRDLAGAQILTAEHDRLKAEIEAREENFQTLVQQSKNLVEEKHYASEEIIERMNQLVSLHDELIMSWDRKHNYLDQLESLHAFLRDAKQIDTISSQQEAYLSGFDVGATMEDVAAQVKKHEAFEKLMTAQDERLSLLQENGTKLIQQGHFGINTIRSRMDEVTKRRAKVREMCALRRQRLADALLYAQFRQDASEAETWIDEKQKSLSVEESKMEVTSLEDKMKKLQKHQAFKAELTAHKDNIIRIKQTGELLLSKRHEASPEIRSQLDKLLQDWNRLLEASDSRGRGLEEAQDILEFNNQVEEVLAWIRDKEMMVQAGETGKDYEHCLALQKKLNDVDSDMRVDENRIKSINSLADKLIRQGRSDTRSLQVRKEELNYKWKSLQGALESYREQLAAALEIHAFNRDIDDTDDRINEKVSALSVEDESKTLKVVEALQRKQETIERDIVAIDKKLKDHDGEGRRLVQKYPEMATSTREKLTILQENWRRLTNLCQTRKQQLASSYTLHKFLSDLKELEVWVNGMIKRMTTGELASSIAEAQNMLQLHQERKAEIDGRQEVFHLLREFGYRLLQQKQTSKENLEQSLAHLDELRRTLGQAWEVRRILLDQCYSLQVFKEHAEQADSWLASKEAFLNNEDLGDSMSSVETLLRKHENFEKTMSAQSDKVNQLETSATELISSNHYDAATISSRCQSICQRRDRLKESALLRRKKLLQSKQLQQFLRNIYEVVGWIHEKITVASDESYRDPTNLLTKIQKHTAFDAELTANKGRVDSVISEGERLISAGHFASSEIQSQVQELQSLWQQLQDHTKLKKERLQDAYQALLVSRMLDDLDHWMDEVENQLQSEDHGKDLTSVQNLLKKHQLLETDIHNHAENAEQVKDLSASFQTCDHFMKDEVEERCAAIVKRYQSLHEPMQIRRDNLEDALLLYQFYHDVDDELSWVQEKEPLAASEELGSSLTSVQNLQKKHQALESEIHAHEPLYATVTSKGRHMIRNNHFASAEVEAKLQVLQLQIQSLKDMASVRRLRLLDALESQTFYSEVSEADTWIKEKKPLLTSSDTGKDEDSVQTLMKKLEALERDVEGYSQNIVKLAKLSQGLIERGHFDSYNIASKQAEVESLYQELLELCQERGRRLLESQKFFAFLRDVDEVEAWIEDQMVVASSEDYGRDVEHVEILIQKFEGFLNTLQANEDRVTTIKNTSKSLINEGHSQSEAIKAQSTEVAKLWRELKECANSRQEALTGAKTVHTFDRSADETICWINEKHAALSSDDYGHDLESIQALVRYHNGFERDLAAVKEQVVMLVEEAKRLAAQYPDASEHIGAKHEEVTEAWGRLLNTSATRKDKLQQAEKLQTYFDDYRELMAWANEMMALITSSELSQDVPGAEALLDRHKEHRAEIDTRLDSFTHFAEQGESLIAGGHFMAEEIRDRITRLNGALDLLLLTWKKRQVIYEQNLDTQLFKLEAEQLEAWLLSREAALNDPNYGESIAAVEELIRKHEDFQKTVEAQEDKFAALNRITKLEEAFRALQAEEQEQKKAAIQRKEQERLDALKRKEQHRILQERKQEDERRRTQEIIFKKGDERAVIIDTDMNGSAESSAKVTDVPEIRPHGMMFKAASQKSLDSERPPPMVRVGSMRVESFTPPIKQEALSGIKRSESVKLDERQKKIKRTPSFTTRKRAIANRQRNAGDLPPVEIEGYLERKQELQSGGKRATIRSWKNYYTVLCGQLLCFFKDKDGFVDNNAAAPPVSLLQARCVEARDYTKKKHVFRIQLMDGAEFLFTAEDEQSMSLWLKKLSFHASLPPSMQLLSYDSQKEMSAAPDSSAHELHSSASSQASSPESKRSSLISSHPSGVSIDKASSQQPNSQESVALRPKPAVPHKPGQSRVISDPPPPPPTTVDGISVKSRIQQFQNATTQNRASLPAGPRDNGQSAHYTAFTVSGHPNQNGVSNVVNNNNLNVTDGTMTQPNASNHQDTVYRRDHGHTDENYYRQSTPSKESLPVHVVRHMSLPAKSQPPGGYLRPAGTLDNRLRTTSSDGSSEGELHQPEKKGKKSMFRLFKKK